MRQRSHNRTFWTDHSCVSASKCMVTNQSLPRARTLADQSDRRSDLRWYALEHTSLVGFLRRASLAGSASLPFPCPALLYTYVLVNVITQSISNQRLPFLSVGPRLILEMTRGYCWRVVFQIYGVAIRYMLSLNMKLKIKPSNLLKRNPCPNH